MSDNKNTDLTIVTVPAILDFCKERGCEIKELKSYFKVTAPEYNKKSLYVGKAKRRMTRLDVSGFVPGEHAAITHLSEQDAKDLKLGAVRAQILPKEIREESTNVLEAIAVCVDGLLSMEAGFKLGKRQPTDEHAEEVKSANEESDSVDTGETEEVEIIPGAVDFLEVAVA